MTDSPDRVDFVVACIRLPMGVTKFAGIIELLVQEHGKALRIRYDSDFAEAYLPHGAEPSEA